MVRRSVLSALLLLSLTSGIARAQQLPVAIVFFVEWSGALDDAALGIIKQAADTAVRAPGRSITVTGYADRKGSSKADIYLSQLRAQVVSDALVADGVPASRITVSANGALPVTGVIGRRAEITFGGAS